MFWHYYKPSKVIKVVNNWRTKISLTKTSQAMCWLKNAELMHNIKCDKTKKLGPHFKWLLGNYDHKTIASSKVAKPPKALKPLSHVYCIDTYVDSLLNNWLTNFQWLIIIRC